MSVIATEGFDHYSAQSDLWLRSGALQWTTANNSFVTWSIVTPGRGGLGACLQGSSGAVNPSLTGSFNVNLAAAFFGFGMTFTNSAADVTVELLDPLASSTPQLMLAFTASTGTIQLTRGGTVIETSAPNAFNASVWEFVEVGATINGTSGSLVLQVNNATVLSYSGNTQVSSNASFGAVRITGIPNTGGMTVSLDDFRWNDTTTGPGTYPCNGFMGDLRVVPLYPTANSAVTWTPLTGANWQEVSETAFDGDTSYNAASTVGDEDLFTMGSVPSAATVIAVSLIGAYRSGDATAHTLTQQLSVGGTDNAGAVQTLALGYQFVSDVFPVNPTTAASWAAADVNTMLAGYKVAS